MQSKEEIIMKIRSRLVGVSAIVRSNVQDIGQSVVAEQKLGDILQLIDELEQLVRKETWRDVENIIPWKFTPVDGSEKQKGWNECVNYMRTKLELRKEGE